MFEFDRIMLSNGFRVRANISGDRGPRPVPYREGIRESHINLNPGFWGAVKLAYPPKQILVLAQSRNCLKIAVVHSVKSLFVIRG